MLLSTRGFILFTATPIVVELIHRKFILLFLSKNGLITHSVELDFTEQEATKNALTHELIVLRTCFISYSVADFNVTLL